MWPPLAYSKPFIPLHSVALHKEEWQYPNIRANSWAWHSGWPPTPKCLMVAPLGSLSCTTFWLHNTKPSFTVFTFDQHLVRNNITYINALLHHLWHPSGLPKWQNNWMIFPPKPQNDHILFMKSGLLFLQSNSLCALLLQTKHPSKFWWQMIVRCCSSTRSKKPKACIVKVYLLNLVATL